MKTNTVRLWPTLLIWLRLEGLMLLLMSVFAYRALGGAWSWLLLGFLADLSFAAYWAGPRIGAAAYNLVHACVLPVTLGLAGWFLGSPLAVLAALIWSAHLGLDRLAGYGLKFPDGFHHTHLTSEPERDLLRAQT
jgi:Domain of unknown function (DUF4260)